MLGEIREVEVISIGQSGLVDTFIYSVSDELVLSTLGDEPVVVSRQFPRVVFSVPSSRREPVSITHKGR